MSKPKFTTEQQQLLRNNPYTVQVTEKVLMTSFFKSYHTFMIKHILNFRHGRQTVDTANHSIF